MQKIAIVAVLIKIFFRDRNQKTPQCDESRKLPRHVVQSRPNELVNSLIH